MKLKCPKCKNKGIRKIDANWIIQEDIYYVEKGKWKCTDNILLEDVIVKTKHYKTYYECDKCGYESKLLRVFK